MTAVPDVCRLVTDADHPMLSGWWQGHGWDKMPFIGLPVLGVIMADSAAGWLYMDNCGRGIAMIEWLVVNPFVLKRQAYRALDAVVGFLKAEAIRMDYRILLATSPTRGVTRLLERHGLSVTEQNMTHLMGKF